MRKSILFFIALIVLNITVGSAFTTASAQTGVSNQTQSVDEQEAAKLYSNISSLPVSERKAFYRNLTPEQKSGLWKAQLRQYLSSHPELTDSQKEVIQSAIAFITPQLFAIPLDNPEWQTKVDLPVQRLEKRFLEVFTREVVRELLTVPGGPEPQQVSNQVQSQISRWLNRLRLVANKNTAPVVGLPIIAHGIWSVRLMVV